MENSELITKALNYIKTENNKNNITVDDVAIHAGFSTDYFNRIFFAHTGFNVMEYVRFSRLKKAAQLLRCTNNDILDIALDCRYEAHESFSRAFKNQYGMSPSEYRKKYEKAEAYYGDFYNDTIGARLLHEFGDFKIADSDEVIEYLLETDAIRYGYIAVCFRVNGGVALYNSKDFRNGFIWFTERDSHFRGEIICDNLDKIFEYKNIFSDERFEMAVYTLESDTVIKNKFSEHGISIGNIKRGQINVYTGEPFEIPIIKNISMRPIKYHDIGLVEKYYSRRYPNRKSNTPRLDFLKHELYQRDVLNNAYYTIFKFGIFSDNQLIGISNGGLQSTHGFAVNNCVATSLLPEYESEELYQYAFKFVTNAALEKGALPVDDIQTPYVSIENKSGVFNSTDLGYKTVTNWCILK